MLGLLSPSCLAPLACIAATLVAVSVAHAQTRWSIDVYGGTALSAPMRLVIRQRGQPDLRLTGRYRTRPLADSPYYGYRVSRWSGDRAWEAELVHHKVYLRNPPPEVEHFEVSHGYNLVLVNRAVRQRVLTVRAGVGAVVGYPETMVRGRARPGTGGLLNSGYHLAGPAVQAAVDRRFALGSRLAVTAAGKLTGAWARVPIADGSADVPNVAAHATLGLGYAF